MSAGMMFVLFKGLIGFGLPIAFASRELYLLRRDRLAAEAEARGAALAPVPSVTAAPPEAAPARRAA